MPEITRQDVKEAVIGALEPFAQAMQGDLKEVRVDISEVKTRLTSVERHLASVEKELKEFRENASELFTKLDRFITLYERQESENRSLANQIARLEERVSKLEAK